MGRRWGVPPKGLRPASLSLIVLIAVAVGCGAGPAGVAGGRDGPNGAPPAEPEKAAPRAVSLGGSHVPAGFAEGSLWATDIFACDDTGGGEASCGVTAGMPIRRLDPRTGEEEEAVELEDFFANTAEVAFGAGSVWVSSADWGPGPVEERRPWDAVYRIDPETNRVADRIPVDAPTGVAFGHGSAWAVSAGRGTLSRIDPDTGEVAARIEVGRGAVDVAVDERGGAVWVAGLHLSESYGGEHPQGDPQDNKLSRVDPETNRVVAEVPISANARYGGAQSVAVGIGAVWAQDSNGKLFKVDPSTNGVVAGVPLGDYSSHLAVTGGSVWVSGQDRSGTWLKRVDPRTVEVDWSRDLGPADSGGYGRLAAGGGSVWFVEGGAGTSEGEGTLARVSP